MVDRVELELLDQPDEVRHLDRDDAVRGEHELDAGDEVVELRDLREHVVRDDEVGAAPFRHERGGQPRVEEVDDRLDAPRACRRSTTFAAGSTPSAGIPACHEVLEQVAVVRGELEHKAAAVRPKALGDHIRVALRVGDPGRPSTRRSTRSRVKISLPGT